MFCLREPGLDQAAVAFEDPAALAPDRLRTDGGEFAAPVGLVECPVRNPVAAQTVNERKELSLAGDGADDQVGVREVGREEGFRNLKGCVAGLDDLLGKGEVVPHEEVDVRQLALREGHGWLAPFSLAQF